MHMLKGMYAYFLHNLAYWLITHNCTADGGSCTYLRSSRASALKHLTWFIRSSLPLGLNGNTCCCSQGVILNKFVVKLEKKLLFVTRKRMHIFKFYSVKDTFFHQLQLIFFLSIGGWNFWMLFSHSHSSFWRHFSNKVTFIRKDIFSI